MRRAFAGVHCPGGAGPRRLNVRTVRASPRQEDAGKAVLGTSDVSGGLACTSEE